MLYTGVDIVEINRIKKALKDWGDTFLKRTYTAEEIKRYKNKPSSLAARFAAKEAVIKVLGADGKSFNLTDIEVLSGDNGQPLLKLHGLAKTRAASFKLNGISLSLSHSRSYAIALAVGQSAE